MGGITSSPGSSQYLKWRTARRTTQGHAAKFCHVTHSSSSLSNHAFCSRFKRVLIVSIRQPYLVPENVKRKIKSSLLLDYRVPGFAVVRHFEYLEDPEDEFGETEYWGWVRKGSEGAWDWSLAAWNSKKPKWTTHAPINNVTSSTSSCWCKSRAI